MNTSSITIKLYGAEWCPDCRMSKKLLEQHNVAYEYINLDEVPDAAEQVTKINNGQQSIPTIVFSSGEILVEPSNEELHSVLTKLQLI